MRITRELIEGCRRDRTKAQMRLYELSYGRLMPVCRRYANGEEDACGLLNQGFYKVLRGLPKYEYKDEEAYFMWSRRIVINEIIDQYRRTKKYREHQVHTDHQTIQNMSNQVSYNNGSLQLDAEHILDLVDQLPGMQKIVFNLFCLESFSHREIAQKFSLSEGTSKWYLSEARKNLRSKLIPIINEKIPVKQWTE